MSMEFILSVTLYPWFFIYQIIKLSIKQLESIQPWNNDILRVLDHLYRPLWVTLYIIFYKEEANIVYAWSVRVLRFCKTVKIHTLEPVLRILWIRKNYGSTDPGPTGKISTKNFINLNELLNLSELLKK